MEPANALALRHVVMGMEDGFHREVLTSLTRVLLLDLSSLTLGLGPYHDHCQTISGFQWPNA